MKGLNVAVVVALGAALAGCGGDGGGDSATTTQVKRDELSVKVYNLYFQHTDVNSFEYKPFKLTLNYDDIDGSVAEHPIEISNYLYGVGSIVSVPEDDANAFDAINYKLVDENEAQFGEGMIPTQFENGKSDTMIFISGDSKGDDSVRVTSAQRPSTEPTDGKLSAYFMNTTKAEFDLQVLYSDALYSDLSQKDIQPGSLSKRVELDLDEVSPTVKLIGDNNIEVQCDLSGERKKHLEGEKQAPYLLVVAPNNTQPEMTYVCEKYPL